MAIATLAIATVSLGGTISLCKASLLIPWQRSSDEAYIMHILFQQQPCYTTVIQKSNGNRAYTGTVVSGTYEVTVWHKVIEI